MPESSDPVVSQWYALVVKPRVERHVGEVLSARGFEVFLPTQPEKRRRSDRTVKLNRPLFANYLFARFRWTDRLAVITSPGVRSVVSFAGVPVPVAEREILRLQRIVASTVPIEPCDYLESGILVRIASGPLHGLEGKLVETKSQRRLVVNVEILHRGVAVEIDRADVEPLALAHHA